MIAGYPFRQANLLLAILLAGAGQLVHGQCNNTTSFGSAAAPNPGNTVQITTLQYAGEYATINGVVAGASYRSSSSTATDYFTIRQGTSGGPVIAFGPQPLTWTATVAGIYYMHCNTNAACGTQNTNRTTSLFAFTAPMAFSSCTTTQNNTTPVSKCSLADHVIIGVEVVTTGNLSPLSATQFTFRTTGSTNPVATNVAAIHVYYTGNSNAFATTTLFGTAATVVNTGIDFTISGTQTLTMGTNYFWLAYDLTPTAIVGNALDAQCSEVTVAGATHLTAVKTPAGNRTIATCPPSPGGVANNLLVWLKANGGVTTSGVNVTGWANQNTSGATTQQVGSPDLQQAGRNYNPTVLFTQSNGDGGDFLRIPSTNVQSFFCAAQLQDNTRECTHMVTYDGVTLGQPCNACAIHGGFENTNMAQYGHVGYGNAYADGPGNFQAAGVWRRNGDPSGITATTQHSGNFDIVTALGTGTGSANVLLGGQNNNLDATPPFNGRKRDWLGPVGELVLYAGPITTAEANRVESYLAIKYGITLGGNGSTTLSYRSAAGTLLWPANSGYHRDVIGIGRDDASVLVQKQSHTPDDSTRLYLQNLAATNVGNTGSFAGNNSFVLAGRNAGKLCATTASNAEMPAGPYSRLEREWKVVNTNFTGSFTFSVRLNACAVPSMVTSSDLRLLTDLDGNFTDATVHAPGGGLAITYAGGFITVSGISNTLIPANSTRYITIASMSSSTPLPVELVAFNAQCTGTAVEVSWTTASEANNSYFTVEASRDGTTFTPLAQVAGAGSSQHMNQYAWTGPQPEAGTSFYRLKQTDMDGTATYSWAVPVHCTGSADLLLFPNPAPGSFRCQLPASSGPRLLEVRNALGQVVWRGEYPANDVPLQVEVGMDGLGDGMYTVALRQGGTVRTARIAVAW